MDYLLPNRLKTNLLSTVEHSEDGPGYHFGKSITVLLRLSEMTPIKLLQHSSLLVISGSVFKYSLDRVREPVCLTSHF